MRWVRRLLVGILATVGLLVLVLAGGIGLAAWLWLPDAPELPERMVLSIDLREGFPEDQAQSDPRTLIGLAGRPTVVDVVLALERAAEDERVQGLVARLSGGGPGLAQAQELRAAILRLRDAGKFAYAHADSFGEFGPGTLGYYLASGFDRIHLQPIGAVGLTGILIETPLLRGLLDRLGILASGDKRGAYKTAADMFTETSLTPAHRESLESLADSLSEQIIAGIAEGRDLAPAEVERLIDQGPHLAAEAEAAGLVDGLGYLDEMIAEAEGEGELVGLGDYAAVLPPPPEGAPVVALVRGVGTIQRGGSDAGPGGGWGLGADTVAGALAEANDDPAVEAILFRIDSPGGSAVASETIGREVRRAVAAGKPVVVSMAGVAASGGYWIAMDATRIVAQPGTITGSIGVLAGKPVLGELWAELGVAWGRVARGANADMWSTAIDFDDAGRARLEAFLDGVYQAFTAGVARGRDLPVEDVLAVAEGRVWTGAQAHELGLVDQLGGLVETLALVRETAGIAPDQALALTPFPRPRPPWERALELLDGTPFGLQLLSPWLRQLDPGVLTSPPLVIR